MKMKRGRVNGTQERNYPKNYFTDDSNESKVRVWQMGQKKTELSFCHLTAL